MGINIQDEIADSELYEHIFCTEYGLKNREELLKIHADKIDFLKSEHEKHGIKINGKAIPFEQGLYNRNQQPRYDLPKEKPPIEFKLDIGGVELGLTLIAIGFALGWFLRNLV